MIISKQKGSILIISLLLLLVATILGLSSMNTTITEERMAGNLRHNYTAFQAAETALREAEAYLGNLSTQTKPEAVGDGANGIWLRECKGSKDVSCSSTLSYDTANSLFWWEDVSDSGVWGSVDSEADSYDKEPNVVNATLPVEGVAKYLIQEIAPTKDSLNQESEGEITNYLITAMGVAENSRVRVFLQSRYVRRF